MVTVFSGCKKKDTDIDVAKRIVCLSPSSGEIICAVGGEDKIVARTDFCDFPSVMNKFPSVGGFSGETISLEAILSFKPDFVYGSSGAHEMLSESLSSYGIKVFLSDCSSLDSLYEEIEYIGKVTDCSKRAQIFIGEMKRSIEMDTDIKDTADKKVKVFYELWNEPFISVGNSSFINDIIEKSGCYNIFSDIKEGYPEVSEESILERNPDIIILPNDNGYSLDNIYGRKSWQNINAVKNKRILQVDGNVFNRPGPRVVDAILELRQFAFGK